MQKDKTVTAGTRWGWGGKGSECITPGCPSRGIEAAQLTALVKPVGVQVYYCSKQQNMLVSYWSATWLGGCVFTFREAAILVCAYCCDRADTGLSTGLTD